MQTENWKRVKELLAETLELEASKRKSFLDNYGIDDEIRAEVESLLAFEEESEDLMNLSAVEFSRDFFDSEEAAENVLIGQQIGVYRVVRELGFGGMSAVYLAERSDGKFDQTVALKLLKREMNTADLRRRFAQEREILASLEHPNIARLLDAGTTADKIPYLAMEYVEGLPIDDFCSKHQYNIHQRLDLFRKVCAAVNFAHRNLIVHRDLKPSNIFVTADGTPKLLDFGISKILSAEFENISPATVTKLGALTPSYASPEQLRGESVTTSTDIYSLGVILYELLSGHRPFEKHEISLKEIYHAVTEKEPPPPSYLIAETSKSLEKASVAKTLVKNGNIADLSTIAQNGDNQTETSKFVGTIPNKVNLNSSSLRGDLDNIVLKSLRKEPERRYLSAENFSEDIRRHQEGLTVTARPNTFSYRAEKFIKRNKVGVFAGVFIFLAIVGGIVATLWQARVAQAERARAEARFDDVRALANSFLFEFSPQIENLPGSTPARELLVKRALEYLDSLSREVSGDPALQRELAAAYEKVGDVQGNPGNPNLGDLKGALASYEKSLKSRQNLSEKEPSDLALQGDLARNFGLVGEVQAQLGDKTKGRELQDKSLAMSERIVEQNPQNFAARNNLAGTVRSRGMIDFWAGKNSQAVEYFNRAKEIYEKLLSENPDNPPMMRRLAGLYMNIGEAQAWNNDFKNAEVNIQKGLEMTIPLAEKFPNDNSMQRSLVLAYLKRGTQFQMSENHEKAAPMFARGLEAGKKLSAADPQNLQAKKDVAQLAAYLGASLDLNGKSADSLEIFKFAVEKYSEIGDPRPNDVNAAYNVASTRFQLGETFLTLKDYQKALETFEIVRDELKTILKKDASYGNAIRDDAFIYDYIGKAYTHLAEKGKNQREFYEKALENQRLALEKFDKMKSAGTLGEFDLKDVEQTKNEVRQIENKLNKQ